MRDDLKARDAASWLIVGLVIVILGLLAQWFSGCQHPNRGDVYENLASGERIEVRSVGTCTSLYTGALTVLDRMLAAADTTEGLSRESVLALVGVPVLLASDSTAACAAYSGTHLVRGTTMPATMIVPIDELAGPRWRRLN